MTNTYKQIQLTNTAISDVAVNSFIPLGNVTRRINAPITCCNTFSIGSSDTNSISVNDAGFYKVTYSLTGTADAEGEITVALVVNGSSVYSVTQYVADPTGAINITLPYTLRAYCASSSENSNLPMVIQIQNTGVALTGSSSNLIVEKI